ncbi:unnamed protein product [Caenorhabditis auriculariae]|uniref:Ubiquitin-like domain-containing protein n=1 Tax=Caenorhabditis auriculariae TaxID=2777116 RepID=A0A8S1GTC6_9PELO|nr:unnamed protein product [Caenorhabditis auriculariae]
MSAGTSASNLREKPKDICVRIDFKDPNRSNLMLMFPRTSNIGDVRSKVEKELGKKYDVRLSHDNYQLADDNIPLSKDGFGDDVTFGCQLATSTPTEMYRHMTEEIQLR